MTNSIETNRDTPDGRLIVSHPKSGRTWLHFALTEAGITARFTHAGASKNRMKMGSPFRGIRASLRDQPLVFLHRNPIDTAVSYYYQIHRRILRRWSARWFRLWVPLFLRRAFPPRDIGAFVLHPHYGVEKICAYNRTWLDHLKNRGDCLIITYEAMRADPATGFQKILDFRGITGTTGVTMADLSTFEKMRVRTSEDGHHSSKSRTTRRPFKRKGPQGQGARLSGGTKPRNRRTLPHDRQALRLFATNLIELPSARFQQSRPRPPTPRGYR